MVALGKNRIERQGLRKEAFAYFLRRCIVTCIYQLYIRDNLIMHYVQLVDIWAQKDMCAIELSIVPTVRINIWFLSRALRDVQFLNTLFFVEQPVEIKKVDVWILQNTYTYWRHI